jgi:hypothetical protein
MYSLPRDQIGEFASHDSAFWRSVNEVLDERWMSAEDIGKMGD